MYAQRHCLVEWRQKMLDNSIQIRSRKVGERLIRRVAGRMRNREVALTWAEWKRNYRASVASLGAKEYTDLQVELEALQMKFAFTTQVQQELRSINFINH